VSISKRIAAPRPNREPPELIVTIRKQLGGGDKTKACPEGKGYGTETSLRRGRQKNMYPGIVIIKDEKLVVDEGGQKAENSIVKPVTKRSGKRTSAVGQES